MPLNPVQRRLIHSRKKLRKPSLFEHAVFNSFYARELKKASRKIYNLRLRIKELEKERHRYAEQVVEANIRVEAVLSLGQEEETIKHELRGLNRRRDALMLEIARLRQVVDRLRTNLREGFKRN